MTTPLAYDKSRLLAILAQHNEGLPPNLLQAVAQTESGINPTAKSPMGALGMMQLMPHTAKELNVDPLSVNQSIQGAAKYLKSLMNSRRFNRTDLDAVLTKYNAGPRAGAEMLLGQRPYTKEALEYPSKVKKILEKLNREASIQEQQRSEYSPLNLYRDPLLDQLR